MVRGLLSSLTSEVVMVFSGLGVSLKDTATKGSPKFNGILEGQRQVTDFNQYKQGRHPNYQKS